MGLPHEAAIGPEQQPILITLTSSLQLNLGFLRIVRSLRPISVNSGQFEISYPQMAVLFCTARASLSLSHHAEQSLRNCTRLIRGS